MAEEGHTRDVAALCGRLGAPPGGVALATSNLRRAAQTLTLTLRVVFNLFMSIKAHLKVQLEVFLTSVHLRLADSPSAAFEQKELALESLLDFCREPALMLDLYTNYDCDVQCTNLFETLCKYLCRNAAPRATGGTGHLLGLK